MSVAAIVLAAGDSSRLGTPKQLVKVSGETLLARTVRVALAGGLDPVLVVIAAGRESDFGRSGVNAAEILLVANVEAVEGMASSIRAGVRALQGMTAKTPVGVVLLACDQPAVTREHLAELALGVDEVVASAYAGRRGVPAYFPVSVFEDLLELRGDTGARELLQAARAVALKDGEFDVDTAEDVERVKRFE
jgi:molybdenum cofactor cytidylyltransferase